LFGKQGLAFLEKEATTCG